MWPGSSRVKGWEFFLLGVGREREVILEMRNKEEGRSALGYLRERCQKAGEGHGKPSTVLENNRCSINIWSINWQSQ